MCSDDFLSFSCRHYYDIIIISIISRRRRKRIFKNSHRRRRNFEGNSSLALLALQLLMWLTLILIVSEANCCWQRKADWTRQDKTRQDTQFTSGRQLQSIFASQWMTSREGNFINWCNSLSSSSSFCFQLLHCTPQKAFVVIILVTSGKQTFLCQRAVFVTLHDRIILLWN